MRGLSIADSVDLLFVGGKGGVGKTSVSAAIALKWSTEGSKTLVVSTDPAHSLGDALATDLSGAPKRIAPGLDAVEVDADAAMAKWRSTVEAFDAESFASRYGALGVEAVRALGVDEFVELLANPPPGIDEIVALADVLRYADDDAYDRVVVDTAPTGHALRLLDLPDFCGEFVGRLVSLRDRVGSLATLAGAFGAGGAVDGVASDVDAVAVRLEDLSSRVEAVRAALADGERTEFLAVCLPTKLAFAETSRLARDLATSARGGGVSLRSVVLNRVVDEGAFGADQASRLCARQRALLDRYLAIPPLSDVATTEAPLATGGQELTGVFGLKFFGATAFSDDSWNDLKEDPAPRLLVCGGKGGVGKTTVAAALGVACADAGLDTIVVSTDPAHSLGDALDAAMHGGQVIDVDAPMGRLAALEVDAEASAAKAAGFLREGLGDRLRNLGDTAAGLADLADAFETAPPGLDELAGLLEVLTLVRSKKWDRIVLDTAPTGHTLRLLALPELLDDFAERSIAARDRLTRNPLVAAALGGLGGGGGSADAAVAEARDRVRELQDDAFALDAILKNPGGCEFVMVAAPTELSLAETCDLKRSLDESGVRAERLVVNGVLDADKPEAFAASAVATQRENIVALDALASELGLTVATAPQFDEDLDGLAGLEALGGELFRD